MREGMNDPRSCARAVRSTRLRACYEVIAGRRVLRCRRRWCLCRRCAVRASRFRLFDELQRAYRTRLTGHFLPHARQELPGNAAAVRVQRRNSMVFTRHSICSSRLSAAVRRGRHVSTSTGAKHERDDCFRIIRLVSVVLAATAAATATATGDSDAAASSPPSWRRGPGHPTAATDLDKRIVLEQ